MPGGPSESSKVGRSAWGFHGARARCSGIGRGRIGPGYRCRRSTSPRTRRTTHHGRAPRRDQGRRAGQLHDGILTIRGEKKSERDERKEKRRYVERSYGSFNRSFRLPGDADATRLEASFKDGVLTISIPKTEEPKPKTIAVKAG